MTAPSPSVRHKRHENRPGSRGLKGRTTLAGCWEASSCNASHLSSFLVYY